MPLVGSQTIQKLLAYYGTAKEIYKAGEEGCKNFMNCRQLTEMKKFTISWKLEEEYKKVINCGVSFLTLEDAEYPQRLRNIPDVPYGIFYKGKLPIEEKIAVAVIGARDCSEYGRYVAEELGKALGQRGIEVISGMAKGIDGISQMAALETGGSSTAVLGCGADICYPSENRRLYQKLLEQGCILSIYPPGTQPQSCLFPPRNRIVSGMADALVVVEARQKSGTLITVDMALEQGREVYVVPGRLTDRFSDGCNRLLKQGANILLSPQEFIQEIEENLKGKNYYSQGKNNSQQENNFQEKNNFQGKNNFQKEYNLQSFDNLHNLHNSQKEKIILQHTKSVFHVTKFEKNSPEALILSHLDFYPKSIEEICNLLPEQYHYSDIVSILMQLCISGEAKQVSAGYFLKERP